MNDKTIPRAGRKSYGQNSQLHRPKNPDIASDFILPFHCPFSHEAGKTDRRLFSIRMSVWPQFPIIYIYSVIPTSQLSQGLSVFLPELPSKSPQAKQLWI